ncbi:XRE family transcriptional regulator [Rhizobium sp. SG741]|uniref:LexA family transcriptional regulator n=1 Tax=Rhizobium sp. SG741 TaxID=2587114 RepID=UPI001444E3AF|nr:XRE family transcriptional regulator [Rhizobium sp. SG741]NKJ03096.1 phage repressor protein C with HTH and peptisase S24 domain [Rhizobium sp. SG741]
MSRLTERLHEQSEKLNVKQIDIATRLSITPQAVNNLFNGRAASSAYWKEIAQMLQISEVEMRSLMTEAGRDPEAHNKAPIAAIYSEVEQSNAKVLENQIPTTRPGRMLPVLGEAVGGDDGEYIFNGQVVDYIACPPSLVNVPDAYSVYVDGESMSPRYKPGETVYVHPRKPPRRGDDVIVQIRGRDESSPPRGFIKEFVGWAGTKLVLSQYNPVKRIDFERDDVVSVHLVVLSGKYA